MPWKKPPDITVPLFASMRKGIAFPCKEVNKYIAISIAYTITAFMIY